MSLPSHLLDALVAISEHQTMLKAAKVLHISQSALTQRIQLLEETLGLTLFIRNRHGVTPTEAALKLLIYCKTKQSLENEVLAELNALNTDNIGGEIKIAGQSSIIRPVVLPALESTLLNNSKIQLQCITKEMNQLTELFLSGRVDFVILDYILQRTDFEHHIIGYETLVLIHNPKHKDRDHIFLDISPDDQIIAQFFNQQPAAMRPKYQRWYMGDEYAMIEGVAKGLGRAIATQHVAKNFANVSISKQYKPLKIPVVLHYRKQPYYSKIHQYVVKELASNSNKYL